MKTMTWTIRLAVGTAAMLALMSQAAQARPAGFSGTQRPSTPTTIVALVPDRVDHIGAAANIAPSPVGVPDRVDMIGTDQQPTPPVATLVMRSTSQGFDWLSAAIGAGSALALMLIASAAVVARGRRRVALSA